MIETFAMQGYGAYIWSAYGISAFLLSGLLYRSAIQWRITKAELLQRRSLYVS